MHLCDWIVLDDEDDETHGSHRVVIAVGNCRMVVASIYYNEIKTPDC